MHTRPDGEGFLSMHLCTCFITQKGATRTCRSASPNIKGMPCNSPKSLSVTVGGATHALLTFPGLRLFSRFWETYSRVSVLISV